jgi:predicted metal-dependent hydrolase
MSNSEPLPPYAYVPGGPWPHPISSPRGHSFGKGASRAVVSAADQGATSPRFLRGVDLFNAGYYWEAHEVWEGLWHGYGRRGVTADVIKGLIKLAAAGVKAREGQEHGVRTHARRAAELFAAAQTAATSDRLDLNLAEMAEHCRQIAAAPPPAPGPMGAPVVRVFAFRIEIDPNCRSGGCTSTTAPGVNSVGSRDTTLT